MYQKRVALYFPADVTDQGIKDHLKQTGIEPTVYEEASKLLLNHGKDQFEVIIIVAGQDFKRVIPEVLRKFADAELIAHDPGRNPDVLDTAKANGITVLDPADHLGDLSQILGRPYSEQTQTLPRILVVEDNGLDQEEIADAVAEFSDNERADVVTASSLEEAMTYLTGTSDLFAVLIADLHLPPDSSTRETDPSNGIKVLDAVRRKSAATQSIVVTGYHGKDETYVHHHSALYRQGAISFLAKDAALEDKDVLKKETARAIQRYRDLISRQANLRSENTIGFDWIIARDERVQEIIAQMQRTARINGTNKTHPILLTGGTGTGKELLTRSFASTKRPAGPFVSINCANIARDGSTVMTTELFGTGRGVFTGVDFSEGILAGADNGTVFFDEIQALSPDVQESLLTVMENDKLPAINGLQERPVDIQFIVATNEPEKLKIDLRNRISMAIDIPPLRERTDLDYLVDFFVHAAAYDRGVVISGVDADAFARLQNYSWPGNIRQLYYVIGRVVDTSVWQRNDGRIRLPDVDAVLSEEITKYSTGLLPREDSDTEIEDPSESADEPSEEGASVEDEAQRWLERITSGERINHLEILEAPGVPGLTRDERIRFGWKLYLRIWDLLDETRKRSLGHRSNRAEFIKEHTGLVDSNGARLNSGAVGKMLNDVRKKLSAWDESEEDG